MKKEFNYSIYHKRIDDDISKALTSFETIQTINEYANVDIDDEARREIDREYEVLEFKLNDLRLKIIFGLEYLGLNTLLKEFSDSIAKFNGNLTEWEMELYNDHDVYYYSPFINLISQYKNVITFQIENLEGNKSHDILILERILNSTGTILSERGITPHKEGDIQKEIYLNLRYAFTETIKEFKIHKIVKNYVPDIGIKNLESAIEVKFACSKEDLKTCIDGIKSDILAYYGSKDWTRFYALIYMTQPFFTYEQLVADIDVTEITKHWRIIPIIGKGDRVKKQKISTKNLE